jgi:hypothetical protein
MCSCSMFPQITHRYQVACRTASYECWSLSNLSEIVNGARILQWAGVEAAIRQLLCRIHPNPCIWQRRNENYRSKNNKHLKVEQWRT